MQPPDPISVRLRVDFGPRSALGPGKIALLEAIDRSGSLSQAALQLGMSYRRAWGLLRDLNREFDQPLATASVGGAHGGGAELTPLAIAVIAAYRAVERAAARSAHEHFAGLVAGAAAPRRGERKPLRRALKKSRRGARRPAKRR
jgi:molybdate transport system regulatory protein